MIKVEKGIVKNHIFKPTNKNPDHVRITGDNTSIYRIIPIGNIEDIESWKEYISKQPYKMTIRL